ncbi:MAG: PEP-CTERM sorting domain-containing protein [Verrucomicrobiales bacterium]
MNKTPHLILALTACGALSASAQNIGVRTGAAANSQTEFSGTQGQDGWTYGYFNNSQSGVDFIPFDDSWYNGTVWDWPAGNPPWTEVNANGGHPNGDNNGDIHSAVRRYTVEDLNGGQPYGIAADWWISKANTGGGNGVTGEVYHNGTLVNASTIGGTDGLGASNANFLMVNPGDTLDFALTPQGTDLGFSDGSDGSNFGARIQTANLWNNLGAVADSRLDFPTGLSDPQGANGWSYGYYDITNNGAPDPGGTDFIPFPTDGTTTRSTGNWWDGSTFDYPDGSVPWTFLGTESGHPNGTNSGGTEEWAVRRYEVQAGDPGAMLVEWDLRAENLNGDGTSIFVLLNGEQIGADTVGGNDGIGIHNSAVLLGLSPGDVIDIALSPQGLTDSADGSDGSRFGARLYAVPEPSRALLLLGGMAFALFQRRRR